MSTSRVVIYGGEGGIRTHGRISPTHAFQACSLNRSDTSPRQKTDNQFNRKRRITHNRAVGNPHVPLLHCYHRLRGRLIGRTPDFGSGYPGSSPGPGANPLASALRIGTHLFLGDLVSSANPSRKCAVNLQDSEHSARPNVCLGDHRI